ncbi:MAG: tRNA uridine-5-carboxymethylaminomethyl(34) synthesis GTPase MnmE [Bacilli bacterium]|nr:tRNA uridine-5-carboxymethylaminomethyl(34) synthesis GTPase MnmE [Bacilli bacterium]
METIVATATAPVKSALALIRISGDDSFAITEKLLGKPLNVSNKAEIRHGTLSYQGKTIDDVVLLCYPNPHSMTGEDVVEITCHGSPLIANEIVEAYLSLGARYATNGEFTSRAFYNGKVDLVQAEAINDLINATTKESKNVALLSLSGKTSAQLKPLLNGLGEALASVEVGIDYPEYDEDEPYTLNDIETMCEALLPRVQSLIEKGVQGQYLRNGIDVALVGEPNVGKSSLLNALLAEDKAIVSSRPGTTRDVVEGEISIKGLPVRLYDTAGIHDTDDEIERLGVERSKKILAKAELILLVIDGNQGETENTRELRELLKGKKILEICNKSDLISEKIDGNCYVSAISGNVENIKEAIFAALNLNDEVYVTPALSSPRELSLLRLVAFDVEEAIRLCKEGLSVDLVSVPLQNAYNHMRQVLGQDPTQDFASEIFSRFCVGK